MAYGNYETGTILTRARQLESVGQATSMYSLRGRVRGALEASRRRMLGYESLGLQKRNYEASQEALGEQLLQQNQGLQQLQSVIPIPEENDGWQTSRGFIRAADASSSGLGMVESSSLRRKERIGRWSEWGQINTEETTGNVPLISPGNVIGSAGYGILGSQLGNLEDATVWGARRAITSPGKQRGGFREASSEFEDAAIWGARRLGLGKYAENLSKSGKWMEERGDAIAEQFANIITTDIQGLIGGISGLGGIDSGGK